MKSLEDYAIRLAGICPGAEVDFWAERLTETMRERHCTLERACQILEDRIIEDRCNPDYF